MTILTWAMNHRNAAVREQPLRLALLDARIQTVQMTNRRLTRLLDDLRSSSPSGEQPKPQQGQVAR